MNKLVACLLIATLAISCKGKPKIKKDYISSKDLIGGEIKRTVASAHRFVRLTTENNRTDTTVINSRSFEEEAAVFLGMPDISANDRKDHYTEDNSFDGDMNSVLVIYSTSDPDEVVRRETFMMSANSEGKSTVQTILVNAVQAKGDSMQVQDLTWHIGHRFQVVTKTSKGNEPEKIKTVQVRWE